MNILYSSVKKLKSEDSIAFLLILLLPAALISGPFLSDLIISICALIFILKNFKEKNLMLNLNKKYLGESIILWIFFLVIILSLVNSNIFFNSLLPSLFYFRFILFTFMILYLFSITEDLFPFLTLSLILVFSILFIDSLIQLFFGKNMFLQYYSMDTNLKIISSFFGDEKKLGSFVSRLLPLVISMLIFSNISYLNKYKVKELLIIASTIMIIMSTERIALLYLALFNFFYFFTLDRKKKIFSSLILVIFFVLLFFSFKNYFTKFYQATYSQIYEKELVSSPMKYEWFRYSDRPLYFSRNHENMFLTSIEIFKDNIFFGSGVKTFREECKNEKYKLEQRCSTHPHNTYTQLLSETGIFSFLIIFFIFLIYFFNSLKILFKRKIDRYNKAILFSNLGIIIHLMPLVPSGSFYNNWISCIFFFNLAINLYLKKSIKKFILK